ncbi:MAG: alpha/beta fold hydrolase [Candidatus Heimdallarchaeota archaeon]|nr:alpha/beta fold hydrolase [Candidatus Heimdallarchaeota archaeon]MCK4876884.1 alpha/beta fold hydrolase [Candidatus Heimdallarchaeota archaeon]
MKEKIEFITTQKEPEFKIRLAKFPSLNEKYDHRNIIIIPGWLSAIDNFTPMAKALQNYSNVIIYEPRGFGKSITTHKKGYFNSEEYNLELSKVIEYLGLKNKEFIILGSCSGGSQSFTHYLDGEGSKPRALVIFHPQEFYNTPFFVPILGWFPTFFMTFVQKMIIVFYRFYLKIRRTGESATVTWAADRLKKNDDWSLRRYVIEFIVKYDIRDRQKEIDIPIQMIVAKKDHFVDPEKSKKFLHHNDSEIIEIQTEMHRVHEKKEDEIAKSMNDFLTKLSY